MVLYINLDGDKDLPDFETKEEIDKVFQDRISEYFEKLREIPKDKIELIDEILFTTGKPAIFVYKFLEAMESLLSKMTKLKRYSQIKHLLHIEKCIVTNSNEVFVPYFIEKEIIFFDTLLSTSSLMILDLASKIRGFRRVHTREKNKWEEIVDPNKYLSIANALLINEWGEDTLIQSDEHDFFLLIDQVNYDIVSGNCNKFRFMFLDPSEDRYLLFLAKLQEVFGQMLVINCKNDLYELPNKPQNLLILKTENLRELKRSELYQKVLAKDYEDKLVLVVDAIPEELVGCPKFKEELIYPEDKDYELHPINNFLRRIRPVINDIDKSIKNFVIQIKSTIKDEKIKNETIEKINRLRTMGDEFDSLKVNFWYELELVNIESNKEMLKRFGDEFDNYYLSSEPKRQIKFRLLINKEKDKWIIYNNNEVVKKVSYSRSKGMKYIAYLVKHYHHKTISDTRLRTVVDTWHGKTKKTAEASTDAKKILQDLIYLFEKQCPELSPLRECITISSKDPGCYFEHKNNITVEIEDDSIPNPI